MSPKPLDEEAIFDLARKIETPEARSEYLEQACNDNTALHERVRALLEVHDQQAEFLESPPSGVDATDEPPLTERPGAVIGKYKLMEQIGEGGMGMVYVAEQERPMRRKVALKIIKPGMDTKEVIARFEAERQALAMMDHPNIAKVFDAGATESGRPYFVMELVRGIPITEYSDRKRLDTDERLELFVSTCHAIQHAHQKGVIHRDVKPSNVLITEHDGTPLPKVIDFGVAKATNQRLTERTVYTRHQQMIGTPLYMSPEQAELSALDVDTRTDIYSLGVILYELLTGVPPFDRKRFHEAAYDEIRRIIREEEPPKPSTRISTLGDEASKVSDQRRSDTKKTGDACRGELDWVVMKALEKDRTRRYETALGFANDVQRYLNQETVKACPPSLAYQVRKFVRRHRGPVLAGLSLLLLLCVGAVGTTTGWIGAVQARRETEEREREALVARNEAVVAHRQEAVQRGLAEEQRQRAELQELAAERQRVQAERSLYSSQLQLAHNAIQSGYTGVAGIVLQRSLPAPGEADYRGWEWYYLLQQSRRDLLQTIYRHEDRVLEIAWSSDNERFATLSFDGTVRIWRGTPAEQIGIIDDFVSATRSICWCQGQLMTAHADGKFHVWDGGSFEHVDQFDTGIQPLLEIAPSRDGSYLAISSYGEVQVWQLSGFVKRQTIELDRRAYDLCWSPTGDRLLICAFDQLGVWGIESADPILQIEEVKRTFAGAWSPDGKRIAVSGRLPAEQSTSQSFQGGYVYDAENGQRLGPLAGHEFDVRSICWHPDGSRIATAAEDHKVRVYDADDFQLMRRLAGHGDEVHGVAWSPDGRRLVSVSHDYTVRIWREMQQQAGDRLEPGGAFGDVAWSPDGRLIASGSRDGAIQIWDAEAQTVATTLLGHTGQVWSVAWNADGTKLASGGEDKKVRIWDPVSGNELRTLSGHEGRIKSVAWSPDGRRMASSSYWNRTILIWDLDTGEVIRSLGSPGEPNGVDWSPDGQLLATAAGFGLLVWEVATGRVMIHRAFGEWSWPNLAFSPDGTCLAFSKDEGVHLLDLGENRVTHSLIGHSAPVNDLGWNPTGRRLATVSNDGTLRIWDAEQGEELVSLRASQGIVNRISWHPSGRALVTNVAGTIRIWDASDGHRFVGSQEFLAGQTARMLWRARQAYLDGNVNEAARAFRDLIPSRPDDWTIWAELGSCYARMGEWEKAGAALVSATNLAPESEKIVCYYSDGVVRLRLGDLAAFRRDCSELIDLVEDSADQVDVAWICSLHPDTHRKLPAVDDLYERVLAADVPEHQKYLQRWIQLRRGDYSAVLDNTFEGETWRVQRASFALAEAYASAKKGDQQRANKALGEAAEMLKSISKSDLGNWGLGWEWNAAFVHRFQEVKEVVSQTAEATGSKN